MKAANLSRTMLAAGILTLALGGCGSSSSDGGGGGGSTVPATGSGGATDTGGSGSGGVSSSGGAGSGGVASTGGSGSGGTTTGSGGSPGTGGAQPGGGSVGSTGGRTGRGGSSGGTTTSAGGGPGSGGAAGGTAGATGGQGTGGTTGGTGGTGTGTGGTTGRGGSSGTGTGTCTASKDTGKTVTGTGPHKVVIETNADKGINCGTIYRPADLGGTEKYPIFVWGEGACSRDGLSNQAAMGEIASWGYFVVADGPPGTGAGSCGSIGMSTDVVSMAKPLIAYIDWAIAENDKPCSKYYQSLDTTKIAADGFSCGGLMAMGTAADPRMTAVGQTSSGLTSDVPSYYKTVHTPFKVLVGGSSDQANPNGSRDYDRMSALGVPIIFYASLNAGHGGDLGRGTGDFNTINLAWLNWQLKGDTGAKGKALLVGSTCKYCTASGWQFKSANLP